MMMELYFDRPSLVRMFFHTRSSDFLTYHTHDLDLDTERANVVYLYRDPVDTVYSQLRYHQQPHTEQSIEPWAELYGRHLDKWLYQERFTERKTIVRYDRMVHSTASEFEKLCHHFDQPFNPRKLDQAVSLSSKERVKKKTPHDPQVVTLVPDYESTRETFRLQSGDLVWTIVLRDRPHLSEAF
jgi:hypothetical protein